LDIPSTTSTAIELFKQAETAYSAGHKHIWRALRSIAREMLTKSGFAHIGSGDYRTVYAIPDAPHVIKIAKNPLGVKENLAAVGNWRQAERLNVDCYLAELPEWRR